MDVICERCHTRYEFDEALVSARGTTVKCTQCGHLFKVHAPTGTARVESWTVQTLGGDRYVYRAMRELQAAISQSRVTRQDVMIPSVGAPRRLGDIEELESFFPDHQGGDPDTIRQGKRQVRTRIGVEAPLGPPAARRAPMDRDGQPLPTRTGTTLRPPAAAPSPSTVLGSLPRAQISPVSLSGPALIAELARASSGPDGTLRSEDSVGAPRVVLPDDAPTRVHSQLLAEADDGPTDPDDRSRGAVPPAAPSSSVGEAVQAMQQAVEEALDQDRPTRAGSLVRDASAAPTLRRAAGQHGFEESELDITDDGAHDHELAQRDFGRAVRISEAPPTIQPPSDASSPSLAPLTPTPSIARPSVLSRLTSFGDPRFSSSGQPGRQPSFARWTIGLVLLGVVTVVAFTLVKRYLPSSEPAASATGFDARVDKFLRAGQDRLAAGDLDGAREQFVMASGVTDTDPRVMQALAEIEVVRADLAWLRVRLLPSDDAGRGAADQELGRATKRAEEATERAAALAPKDRGSIRLRISVLRLGGDRDGARSLVEQLRDPSPQDALVLAALDLGEKEPSWPSVIDRLQTAARAEQRLGRARAMLVYALARAGQKDAAGKELELLASYSPPHPLLDPLRRFVDGATASAASIDDGGAAGPASSGAASAGAGGDEEVPSDFREALRRAQTARAEGKLDRAETLYRAALSKSPGNSEALEGVAEVARARGDSSGAIAAYESLLRSNPAYLPALAALADLKWQTGARGEALALYRQVVEAAPGSSYAKHAQSRLDSSAGATTSPGTTSPAPSTTASPPPTAAPTGTLPPGIDVSDLPELH
jgi:predicted Zn finger-like uncharacterized protein